MRRRAGYWWPQLQPRLQWFRDRGRKGYFCLGCKRLGSSHRQWSSCLRISPCFADFDWRQLFLFCWKGKYFSKTPGPFRCYGDFEPPFGSLSHLKLENPLIIQALYPPSPWSPACVTALPLGHASCTKHFLLLWAFGCGLNRCFGWRFWALSLTYWMIFCLLLILWTHFDSNLNLFSREINLPIIVFR